MKTARVIITFDCSKHCSYCVNKYNYIMKQAIKINDLDKLKGFDEIVITGGEPMLDPQTTLAILKDIWSIEPDINKYMYTALYSYELTELIEYLNGITYTIHGLFNMDDLESFTKFQEFTRYYNKDKSYRLAISPTIERPIMIYPYLWKEIKIKDWKEEGRCKIPEHETLFIYEE